MTLFAQICLFARFASPPLFISYNSPRLHSFAEGQMRQMSCNLPLGCVNACNRPDLPSAGKFAIEWFPDGPISQPNYHQQFLCSNVGLIPGKMIREECRIPDATPLTLFQFSRIYTAPIGAVPVSPDLGAYDLASSRSPGITNAGYASLIYGLYCSRTLLGYRTMLLLCHVNLCYHLPLYVARF